MRKFSAWLIGSLTLSLAFGVGSIRAQEEPAAEAHAGHEGWVVDFEVAKKTASAEKKDILMEFTGSDWCPPCKQLYANVISTDMFKEQAPQSFTLLLLDNPRDKSHQTEAEQAQYTRMAAEYGIEGVPTIILADAEGKPYAKLVGYGGDTPEVYIAKLKEETQKRVRRDEAMAKAAEATGLDRAKLLAEAIGEIDPALAVSVYREVVDEIIALDASDEAGLKTKFTTVLKTSDIEKALREIQMSAREAQPAEIVAKIDELIKNMEPSAEQTQQILFVKANILFATDKAASKEALLAAQAAAPESPMAKQIEQIIARFFAEPQQGGGDQ